MAKICVLVNLEQFNRLPVRVKCHCTPQIGRFLMSIEEYYYGIALYAVRNFYVEMWYHREWRSIIKIRSFKKLNPESPYLKRIGLGDILKSLQE